MEYFIIGVLVFLQLGIVFCMYMLYRNSKVLIFRLQISNLEWARYEEAIKQGLHFKWRNLHDKYTYKQMLYSSKPLKLERWFTKEEVEHLTRPIVR